MENISEMLKGVLDGILLQIMSGGEIYGYEIVRILRGIGFGDIAEGTVYAALMRLERSGLTETVRKQSDIGPPRKFYTLSVAGEDELSSFWRRWYFLAGKIDIIKNYGGKSDAKR